MRNEEDKSRTWDRGVLYQLTTYANKVCYDVQHLLFC